MAEAIGLEELQREEGDLSNQITVLTRVYNDIAQAITYLKQRRQVNVAEQLKWHKAAT